jgi:putative N-acetyltransferase (TIGR04045 family)
MSSSYLFELAYTRSEIAAYYSLRRKIFVEEQALFQNDDVDDLDAIAYPIIAVEADAPDLEVLGIVRIYEPEPRLWYGGRLGTHPEYRRGWHIGKGLITKAVTTANAWGCDRFLATVQIQNVRFFQRLHWDSLEEIEIRGITHHLMQADLDYYPANNEIRPAIKYSQASWNSISSPTP